MGGGVRVLNGPVPGHCILVTFFTSTDYRQYYLWSCQNACDALPYLYNFYTRFGIKLYRQIVGSCLPHVADLFLLCYERDFNTSFSDDNQTDIIEAFYPTSRYLDDLLNMDTPYSKQSGQTNLVAVE